MVIREYEVYEERFALVRDRMQDFLQEGEIKCEFRAYFASVADFLTNVAEVYDLVKSGAYERLPLEKKKELHDKLYANLAKDIYEKSFLSPAYLASHCVGEGEIHLSLAQLLSALYADALTTIPAAYEGRLDILCIFFELVVEMHGIVISEEEASGDKLFTAEGCLTEESCGYMEKEVRAALYSFYHDYSEVFAADAIAQMFDVEEDFYTRLIREADLMTDDYLYRTGAYISENELGLAAYLRTLSQEEIDAMAATFTEGYRKGFEITGKDITKKRIVRIEAPVGFERVVRAAMEQFGAMGLMPTMRRESTLSMTGRGGAKRDYYSTSPNRQFDFDHKDDRAIYFDKAFVERRLEVMRDTFEAYKPQAKTFGGPAVIEIFGEEPFAPQAKETNVKFSDKQNELNVYYMTEAGKLTNTYIPGDEYSFTIIAYPLPAIGTKFEEIFAKTVALNNLDYAKYQAIQQKIIDALDFGTSVHVTGRGANHTDIHVQLHPLSDPSKETIFENCVADVNIPVGEVFTSPMLEGTNGVLHVTQVYLGQLCYKDLEIQFVDGKVASYRCANFADEEENLRYIKENVLYRHETLPLGEFAIGTNTTAYRMARDYAIADKLPILIAEKTGPHFAVGDTCYSHAEDVPMYNPDGKEVIARDNSCSILRKDEKRADEAYYNCHTDITIPYDELGDIMVECQDGHEIAIIREGRFVLPGTEELNEELNR